MPNRSSRFARILLAASPAALIAGCATLPADDMAAMPAAPAASPAAFEPAPVNTLVDAVNIPYEKFTLPNGLQRDRPRGSQGARRRGVGVVSCRLEGRAQGQDGLCPSVRASDVQRHRRTSPGDFFEPLQQVGATDFNGTTNVDRTNYFETVPTGALERALFLESDRMGHLLGAVTQEKLDNQRGVVQNEKRQGDNQPYGLLRYEVQRKPVPVGPPLSSLDDRLDGRSRRRQPRRRQELVPRELRSRTTRSSCSPATSTPRPRAAMSTKWFGDIPRGPDVTQPAAPCRRSPRRSTR